MKTWMFAACLGLLCGCGADADDSAGSALMRVDALTWASETEGGYDDFGSEGAAFGYAVDDSGRVLVIGLKFSLPVYQQMFAPADEPLASAVGWQAGAVNVPMADDVVAIPDLEALITDTAGLRGMPHDMTALLYEPANETLWIAVEGTLELTREEGPYDQVVGSLVMREVTAVGEGAALTGDTLLPIESIDIRWDTGEIW